MKLFDLQKGSKIIADCSDGSKHIVFDHVDGMYSYCTTENGAIVHLRAGQLLEKVEDGMYKLTTE